MFYCFNKKDREAKETKKYNANADAGMPFPRFPNGHCLMTIFEVQMTCKYRKNCNILLFC